MNNVKEKNITDKKSTFVDKLSIEFLRMSILVLLVVGLMKFWLIPKLYDMIEGTNHAKIAILNIAKITNESRITDGAKLIVRVKEVRNELIDQGYVVIDATTVLGRSTAYEIPVSMIDKDIPMNTSQF